VAQRDSRDCAGEVSVAQRGVEAVFADALLQDHHQFFGDHRQCPGHLSVREPRIQVELTPGRLVFHESHDDIDSSFPSRKAGDPAHRPFHCRVETTSYLRPKRIDEVFFGDKVAIDGRS
jgi:hypothetical protein